MPCNLSIRLATALCLLLFFSTAVAQPTRYELALGQDWPAGKVPQGIGFRVDGRGLVLTAAHVLAGCRRIWVEDPSGRVELHLIGLDAVADLALLHSEGQLSGPPIGQLGVALAPGERGQVLAPDGPDTVITAVDQRGEQSVFVPALRAGLSGGPVLSDYGLVVGLASAVDARRSYIIGPETIARFLQYHKTTAMIPRSRRLPHVEFSPKNALDRQMIRYGLFKVECN